MQYAEFIDLYGDRSHWLRAREDNHYFESDLRDALAGDPSGFRETAFYGRASNDIPLLVRDLWQGGVPIRWYRRNIQREWTVTSRIFVDAFGNDLDAFLRDAGFSTGRLPEEFDVWRGGTDPFEVMVSAPCWAVSYSVACAFAFQSRLWRNARDGRLARELGQPEPRVVTRRVRRQQVAAWIGGIEREVVLGNEAIGAPAQPCGSLRDWRQHGVRRRDPFVA
jgi:hypothetical protein